MQESEVAARLAQDVMTYAEPITLAFLAAGAAMLLLIMALTGRAAMMLREVRRLYETARMRGRDTVKPSQGLRSTSGIPMPTSRKAPSPRRKSRKDHLLT